MTALSDAINLGMSRMKRATNSNKVAIVQEGGLYTISIFDRSATLQKLAESSGGRAYRIRELDELPDVATKISEELHSRYILAYAPPDCPRNRKYRRVKVQLVPKPNAPPMRASWRRGYYPSEPVTGIARLLGWRRLVEFLEWDPDQKHRFFKPSLMHVLHPGKKPGISVPFVEQQHPCISSEDKRRRDNLHMVETT